MKNFKILLNGIINENPTFTALLPIDYITFELILQGF